MILHSVSVGARRRFRRSRARWVRRFVAVAVVAVLAVTSARPAYAVFDWANPAAWAVVVQMGIVISKMVGIKRQVENVRNIAKSHALGAFAPLVDGLKPLTEKMREAREHVRTAQNLAGRAMRPSFPVLHTSLTPIPTVPFNGPLIPCTAATAGFVSPPPFVGPPDPNAPPTPASSAMVENSVPIPAAQLCMPAADDVFEADDRLLEYENVIVDAVPEYMPADFTPRVRAAAVFRREQMEHVLEQRKAEAIAFEDRMAKAQAAVETMVLVTEEVFGCVETPDTPPLTPDLTQELPFCLGNGGKGLGDRADGTGTQGIVEDLQAKLDTIQRQPNGDASLEQLAAIQTQTQIGLARLEAARANARAFAIEEENIQHINIEARQRRSHELFRLSMACQVSHGPYSQFVPKLGALALNPDSAAATIEPRDDVIRSDGTPVIQAGCTVHPAAVTAQVVSHRIGDIAMLPTYRPPGGSVSPAMPVYRSDPAFSGFGGNAPSSGTRGSLGARAHRFFRVLWGADSPSN